MPRQSSESLKKCTSCGELLPAPAFNRRTKSPDGRASACRRCANARHRSRKGPRQSNQMRAAIKVGDIRSVQKLVSSSSVELDQLLALATQNYNTAPKQEGHIRIVEFLLAQGASPSRAAMFEAARDGNQEIVNRLIEAGAELDIFACSLLGDLERVKALLRRDRKLALANTGQEIVHYRDFTPLHCCSMSKIGKRSPPHSEQQLEVAKRLLQAGADPHAKAIFHGGRMVTPLDMLAMAGGSLALARLLIGRGATISIFAFMVSLSPRGLQLEHGLPLAELFLEAGFDINSGIDDRTALHAAANSSLPAIATWLLQHGADVNARGRMGRTPLHLAAERNMSSRIVDLLIEAGADLRIKDDQGLTALDVAILHKKNAVAQALRRALASRR